MPGQWLQPHVPTTPMPSARWVTCCWGGGQGLWDVLFVGERWFFSSNQERVRNIVVPWAFQEFPSFSPSFFAFEQTKQVFGNCCVGKATGVFWNQALSCRGYFCHTSRGFNLLYPTIHSYSAAKMIELNASIFNKKVRSKRSRVLQPCLSQSGLGPGLSGQAWLFHTWDSWPPGCD